LRLLIIKSKEKSYSEEPTFKLNLIYTEYGKKIDIACLDPGNKLEYGEYKEKTGIKSDIAPLWNQPLLIGIELKYIKCGYKYMIGSDTVNSDKLKLEKYKNTGFAPNFKYLVLCFLQEDSSKVLDIIRKEKIEKLDETGDNDFDNIFFISNKATYKLVDDDKN
jgi:hypothetical protein